MYDSQANLTHIVNNRFDKVELLLAQLKEITMSTQDDVNAITADLTTVATTLSDAIARLEADIAADTPPDLTALKNVQATLDALAAANPEPTPPAV